MAASVRKSPLVVVIHPSLLLRNKSSSTSQSRGRPSAIILPTTPPTVTNPTTSHAAITTAGAAASATPTLTTATTLQTDQDIYSEPHNEVERRRKKKISNNIKSLAETVRPPCHCGKQTRAEILEKVVDQIRHLQQNNADLRSKIEGSSSARDVEMLCREVMVLLLENVRLRILLTEHQQREKSSNSSACETSEPGGPDGGSSTTGREAGSTSDTNKCISPRESHSHDRGGELEMEMEPVGEMLCSAGNGEGGGGESGEGDDNGCVGGGSGGRGGGSEGEGGGGAGRAGGGGGGGGRIAESGQNDSVIEGSGEGEERSGGTGGSDTGGGSGEVGGERNREEQQPWPVSCLLSDPSVPPPAHQATPLALTPSSGNECPTTTTFTTTSINHGLIYPGVVQSISTAPTVSSALASNSLALPSTRPPEITTSHSQTRPTHQAQSQTHLSVSAVYTCTSNLPSYMTPTCCSISSTALTTCTPSHHPHPLLSTTAPSPYPEIPPGHSRQSIVQPWLGGSSSRGHTMSYCTGRTQHTSSTCSGPFLYPENGRHSSQHVRHDAGNHQGLTPNLSHSYHHHHQHHPRHHPYPPSSSRLNRIQTSLPLGHSSYTDTPEQYGTNFASFSSPNVLANNTYLPQSTAHNPECLYSYPSMGNTFNSQTGPTMFHHQPSQYLCGHSANSYPYHSPQQQHHSLTLPSPHNHYEIPHPTPSFTHPHHPSHTPSHNTVWRPYSDRERTSGFGLSDILSLPPTVNTPGLAPPHSPPPTAVHQTNGGRIPSFLVDHLLYDL